MASLFDAIVGQNISVLTRGNTLRPHVLLLGGPNTFIRGMVEAWRHAIPLIWKERKTPLPEGRPHGADPRPGERPVLRRDRGRAVRPSEEEGVGVYRGTENLRRYIDVGRIEEKQAAAARAWRRTRPSSRPSRSATARPCSTRRLHARRGGGGVHRPDGGSTSTKAALLDKDRNVLVKSYQLSKGNPIVDTQEVLSDIEQKVQAQGATLKVMGIGTTGYAKDILRTPRPTWRWSRPYHRVGARLLPRHHVDLRRGGQDIKLIILKNRQVKDFKLNTSARPATATSCSPRPRASGSVKEYATSPSPPRRCPPSATAARCSCSPTSSTSSARAGSRRRSWPASPPCCRRTSGSTSRRSRTWPRWARTVLQGGTQHNLAAVKAQVDFIESRFAGKDTAARARARALRRVRRDRGAIEAVRLWENHARRSSSGWRACATSRSSPTATRTRAASSARTSACAPSST